MDFQGSYSSLTFDSDDESIEFNAGPEDSLEDSFSLGLEEDEEDEEDENGYNRWYLQKGGVEFLTPILFEDGMDYSECSLYYQAHHSQTIGGVLTKSSHAVKRRDFVEQVKHNDSSKPRPCLRINYGQSCINERPNLRRCSFGGIRADGLPNDDFELKRSCSAKNVNDHDPRVTFQKDVKVVTIHPIAEYPSDVRFGLWMTREEMAAGVRSAMSDEAREQRKKQFLLKTTDQKGGPVKEVLKEGDDGENTGRSREDSTDSVILECFQTLAIGRD